MNKFIVLMVGIILPAIVFFSSCKKEESNIEKQNATNNYEQLSGEKIVLGKKLENPYSVANMKRAYAELKKEYAEKNGGDSLEDINIYTTNLYVRFLPANIDEYDTLVSDTTLELFDHPLDYEISGEGSYYHDPDLPADQITWQYCAPKVDHELPDIEREIIEELYLPLEDTLLTGIEKSGVNLAKLLELKSLQLTNNISDEEYKQYFEKDSWHPSGTIKVHDDFLGDVPVVGVEVRVNNWFYYSTAWTSSSGYFYFNSDWSTKVDYTIKFQREYFDVRNGVLVQAKYEKHDLKTSWSPIFYSEEVWRYCHIFRAAYGYFYSSWLRGGLSKPASMGSGIKIAYIDKEGEDNGNYNPYLQYLNQLSIKIWGRTKENGSRDGQGLYATTIHELAHSSHWNLIGTVDFQFVDIRVAETWATGVQWYITRKVYTGYFGRGTSMPKYTQFVVDMVDGFGDLTNNGESGAQDMVTGYSMAQIESTLKGSKTPNEWRNNIRNNLINATENAELDLLFTRWF